MNFTILRIAWLNVWRNKFRSSIVILATTIGLFGGLAVSGLTKGMMLDMVEKALENQVSNIQIHDSDFVENNEVGYLMKNTSGIIDQIKSDSEVKAVSQRTKSFGMASTASKAMGIMINGIEPENEKQVTKIYQKLTDSLGTYFTSTRKNSILIGEKLAKNLNAKIKSKIVITFQDYEGNLTGASFRVEGIFKTQNSVFDEQNVFVLKSDFDKVLNLPPNSAHEIAVLLKDYHHTAVVVDRIKKIIPKEYLVEGWYEIDPYLKLSSSMTQFMLLIFMTIILLALGFAIVNTMLMVVLERTKELGMIMAIGMNRFKVFRMILYETSILAMIGGIFGIVVSAIFTWYFGNIGIDISSVGEGFAAMGYSTIMYPLLEMSDYVQVGLLVLITGIIASIFPTIRALKMKPVEAIRD